MRFDTDKSYLSVLADIVNEIFLSDESDMPFHPLPKMTSLTVSLMYKIQKVPLDQKNLLEKLYEAVFSLHLLRYRMNDLSTLQICVSEMKMLSDTLQDCLRSANLSENKIQAYGFAVDRLESLFENTIQYVLADPVIFLLFVHLLKSIRKILNHLIKQEAYAR